MGAVLKSSARQIFVPPYQWDLKGFKTDILSNRSVCNDLRAYQHTLVFALPLPWCRDQSFYAHLEFFQLLFLWTGVRLLGCSVRVANAVVEAISVHFQNLLKVLNKLSTLKIKRYICFQTQNIDECSDISIRYPVLTVLR